METNERHAGNAELQKTLDELTPLVGDSAWMDTLDRDQLRNLWIIGSAAEAEIRRRENI